LGVFFGHEPENGPTAKVTDVVPRILQKAHLTKQLSKNQIEDKRVLAPKK
jgi:hypothetical protein